MKLYISCLAVLLMFTLAACGPKEESVNELPMITEEAGPTQTVTPPPTITEEPADTMSVGPLSEEEIRFFNEEFFAPETDYPGRWVRNNILYSEFATPAQVDIEAMLYVESGAEDISDEEHAYLKEQGAMDLDTSKFEASYINELMQNYLGISLEESEKKGLDRFFYYAETDAYYLVRSDAMVVFVRVEEGRKNEDGTITLVYRQSMESFQSLSVEKIEELPQYQVKLKKTENGYQFLSNQIKAE